MEPTSLPSSIHPKISVSSDGCWLWEGHLNHGGYGLASIDGKQRRLHRVAYELLVGPIPDGLVLDHLCRVRHCCNPEHLEPVTRRTNTLRGVGPAPAKAAQSHCVNGHELAGDNLYIHPQRGTRNCRTCMRETARRRRAGLANTGVCAQPGCDRVAVSRGLCPAHYGVLWRSGAVRESA